MYRIRTLKDFLKSVKYLILLHGILTLISSSMKYIYILGLLWPIHRILTPKNNLLCFARNLSWNIENDLKHCCNKNQDLNNQ